MKTSAEDGDQHGFYAGDVAAQDRRGPPMGLQPQKTPEASRRRRRGRRNWDRRVDVQQFEHRRAAGQREELLIHGVEQPAERGDQKDEPVITVEFFIPSAGERIG